MNSCLMKKINIITRRQNWGGGGPFKVFQNTCKGLDLLGCSYVINMDPRGFEWNWVHDSYAGLYEIALRRIPAVLGPNIIVLPKDFPVIRPRLDHCIYLHPCQWLVDLWKMVGYNESEIAAWPSAIDIDEYDFANAKEKRHVMVYFKERDPTLIFRLQDILAKIDIIPEFVHYGYYTQAQYKNVLSRCSFGIWIGRHETQGYALLEALAARVPLIVLDAKKITEAIPARYPFPAYCQKIESTSAPYFDDSCGVKIDSLDEIEEVVRRMMVEFSNYNPRQYVIKNFTYEKCAQNLLNFFERLQSRPASVALSHKEFSLNGATKLLMKVNSIILRSRRMINSTW